ncbi:cold-inducible protein YdjO-related protein [Peribacillus kribbensis]|uniref:cold-inducible protein YdjO-related protein n=1 Tax=Peribacillus kribbensis TaxID=356658 RepID=UPI0004086CA0|nr:cold-inducible protein YdjO-related protein [Peribacillus kribbensis]
MYNGKKWEEPLPKEQIAVWECLSQECNGWMRKEYSFQELPDCPLCGEKMEAGERLLVKIPPNIQKNS